MVVRVEIDNDNNEVLIYKPRCPKCNESMVKGFFRYQADARMNDRTALLNEVTFGLDNMLVYMLFMCDKHRDQRVEMTPQEVSKVAGYLQHQVKFVPTPKIIGKTTHTKDGDALHEQPLT